jgi:hypothetical protein
MTGESPLSMMRTERRPPPRRSAAAVRRRRLWPVLLPLAIIIALALGWSLLWYYAASVAERTLGGWLERETAAGRAYSCGSQDIGGFPLRIEARCTDAAAQIKNYQPPFSVTASAVVFASEVYRPTLLRGEIIGPLTVATALGQPPDFAANWSHALLSVRGLPPDPERFSVAVDRPHVDRITGTDRAMLFMADHVELDGRIVAGSARANPVIDASGRFAAATAPSLHPLLAAPLAGEFDAVLRGFKDLSPKPWAERFREMHAAGGTIEIKSLRIERQDAIIVGNGSLTVNEHGKLDGLVRVAVVGVETIVPLLGLDRLIGQGIDRLTGSSGPSSQGLGALDRLLPGLSGAVRDSANASLIESIKKMGQPAEIDKKPAIVLPLRFADGSIYLGMIPLGSVPPLF